jgi:hypothetical protein
MSNEWSSGTVNTIVCKDECLGANILYILILYDNYAPVGIVICDALLQCDNNIIMVSIIIIIIIIITAKNINVNQKQIRDVSSRIFI